MGGFTIPELARDLIINIINILILFVIVRALVYKPVKKFLDGRTARINAMKSEAEEKLKKADEAVAEHESMLAKGKDEGAELIHKAERSAKENADMIIEAANQNAKAITQKANAEIEEQRNRMISSMQEEITDIAVGISEKILSRSVTDADNLKIAEDFFSKSDNK